LRERLQRDFPDIEFDTNDHFSLAEGREYARQQLNWPDVSTCHIADFRNLRVGLIDAKVDLSHPQLQSAHIESQTFVQDEDSTSTHGTMLSQILVGTTSENEYQGLIAESTVYAASVMTMSRTGPVATVSSMVKALDWLLSHEVRLVNISLASQQSNRVLERVMRLAVKRGALIFAAVGNEKLISTKSFPAAYEGIFAVTAVDVLSHIYSQANQGGYIDFSAPGVDIWIKDKQGKGAYVSGTSFATPYVLALAAFYVNKHLSISRDILYAQLKSMSDDLGVVGYDSIFGWGAPRFPVAICQ
jgi:subtilisin family serine protease